MSIVSDYPRLTWRFHWSSPAASAGAGTGAAGAGAGATAAAAAAPAAAGARSHRLENVARHLVYAAEVDIAASRFDAAGQYGPGQRAHGGFRPAGKARAHISQTGHRR